MSENLPPDWAILRALNLMLYGGLTIDLVKRDPDERYEVIAFARYIAQYEDAPDDPLLAEAEAIAAEWFSETPPYTDALLQAIKRGIELAKAGSHE